MRRWPGVRPRAIAALLALSLGCARNAPPVAVHGKVFYHGHPVAHGMIVFTPDSTRGSEGPFARADIQPDGSFELRTEDQPLVRAGWYRITVVALAEPMSPGPFRDFAMPRSLLPDKYRDPELSGLSCEVKAGQPNRFDFQLD